MPFLSEVDQDQLQHIFAEQKDGDLRLRVPTRPPSKLYVAGQRLRELVVGWWRCHVQSEVQPCARFPSSQFGSQPLHLRDHAHGQVARHPPATHRTASG